MKSLVLCWQADPMLTFAVYVKLFRYLSQVMINIICTCTDKSIVSILRSNDFGEN